MGKDGILARELAKLGAVGGMAGGILTGSATRAAAGAVGAASGAWLAARYLPTEQYGREMRLPVDPKSALSAIMTALAQLGRLQDNPGIDSPNPTVAAVISSGFMNLNPCVVTVELVPQTTNETLALVSGGAKEGLVKQRTAEKAVLRVIDAIQAVLG